ncbi:MAG TPA: OmpA family protein [Dyadobacter sp.]|jgi:outer membrane protein OmpA-like peptidoglycan-associated protein|nr:OmpA family protein [Dyadobacter sp.]
MDYKINAAWLCFLLLFLSGTSAFSQSQWTYDFNNGLTPIESKGIQLKVLGQPGQYVKEPIPGSEGLYRTTYKFETNSGLQFDNTEAKGFLSKSFTVEIYFKMDTLGSWKRVLDFRNRKSDYGCYIYDGKLNFYDFAISEKAPVRRNQYLHYVYSRDFETKTIKMYINGIEKLEFKDPGTEGMLDQDQVLNLFQDDLVANHEASSGSVALIRLYDRVMTPVFIRRSYQTILKTKPPVETVAEKEPEPVKEVVKETPVSNPNLVTVTGKVYNSKTLKPIEDANVSVWKAKDESLVANTKTIDGTYQVQLPPYETYRVSVEAIGFDSKSMSVKTAGKSQEVKSLFNLSAESYDQPVVTMFFGQSSEVIPDDAKTKLDAMVDYFNKRPDLKIVLKGHTDNIGNFEKNVELSRQRVESVKAYLTARGIPSDRINGSGYGSAQPSYMNKSESQKQLNRRVEVWAEPVKR